MPIKVDRYRDSNTLEIKLELPQGESFLVAGRNPDSFYDLSVVLPWYVGRHSIGAEICFKEALDEEEILLLYESPAYELIAVVRKSLPGLERLDRDEDLEI